MATKRGVLKFLFLGDASNLSKTAKDVDNDLDKLGRSSGKLSSSFRGHLESSISDVTDRLRAAGPVGESAAGMLDNISGKAMSMSPAMLAAGGAATAAAAAIAGLGVASVNAFQDGAAEVRQFSLATGIAAEESSRWLAAAGDLGVEAQTLQNGFGRLAREIGKNPEKLEEFGVSVVRAKDGTVDMNATALNLIDRLKQIKDPAERARVGNELLGRSWQKLAPLINEGSEGLKEFFDEADRKGEIFSQDDLDAAQDLNLAIKDVKEAFNGMLISIGRGIVPAMGNWVASTAALLDKLSELERKTGLLKAAFGPLTAVMDGQAAVMDMITGRQKDLEKSSEDVTEQIRLEEEATAELAEKESALAQTLNDLEAAERKALAAYNDRVNAITGSLTTHLEVAEATRNYERAVINAKTADEELAVAQAEGTLTAEEFRLKELDVAAAHDNVTRAALGVAKAEADRKIKTQEAAGVQLDAAGKAAIQRDELVKLQQTMAPGSALHTQLQGMIDQLNSIPRHIPVRVTLEQAGINPEMISEARRQMQAALSGNRATGGDVQAGQAYRWQEAGSRTEVFVPDVDGTVVPRGHLRGAGSSISIGTLNVGSVQDASAMRAQLDWLMRTGGN